MSRQRLSEADPNDFGVLSQKTILRFTHATKGGAGTESHLEYLNDILLKRNAMTILYLYMPDEADAEQQTENIGKGTLIKIPMLYKRRNTTHTTIVSKLLHKGSELFLKRDCYIKLFREAENINNLTNLLFKDYKIDLTINHFVGGKDSLLFMKNVAARKIPILVINHFNNSWFKKSPIRKQLQYVQTVAGLSNVNMPQYLTSRFVNLSNGIDTDFFNPDQIQNLQREPHDFPILFLPARVVKSKGHLDLLKTALYLKNHGLNCSVVFAGREDSSDFKLELLSFISTYNLTNQVLFTGTLMADSLRLWYKKSTLVVLPTYHDEGLPRVLLEAQAMGIPPITYNSGGVSEAILNNQTGFYSKKGDLTFLRKTVAMLITDENKRAQIANNGRKFVSKNFSLNALAERHERTYLRLIRSAKNCF